ncbi:DUF1697 domain-containing protein [Candidatus Gracilibacteria bacterium]|nr:DUF1697 domain-containing protein [Candidatus Gracilibacteria bacterium]
MPNHLALLRGINVGGNNIIKMADLKVCFESLGFSEVKTYIQSGNVIFHTTETSLPKLTTKIETALSKKFNYQSSVVIITIDQLQTIIKKAPINFGQQPEKYRYDVLFLKPPLTSAEAIKQLQPNPAVDQAATGQGVLYFSRLIAKATASRLTQITKLPLYKQLTIRNWNTTTKLLQLTQPGILNTLLITSSISNPLRAQLF